MTDKEMRYIWAMIKDLINHEFTMRNLFEELKRMVKQ